MRAGSTGRPGRIGEVACTGEDYAMSDWSAATSGNIVLHVALYSSTKHIMLYTL